LERGVIAEVQLNAGTSAGGFVGTAVGDLVAGVGGEVALVLGRGSLARQLTQVFGRSTAGRSDFAFEGGVVALVGRFGSRGRGRRNGSNRRDLMALRHAVIQGRSLTGRGLVASPGGRIANVSLRRRRGRRNGRDRTRWGNSALENASVFGHSLAGVGLVALVRGVIARISRNAILRAENSVACEGEVSVVAHAVASLEAILVDHARRTPTTGVGFVINAGLTV
jgi:hypothetical protein